MLLRGKGKLVVNLWTDLSGWEITILVVLDQLDPGSKGWPEGERVMTVFCICEFEYDISKFLVGVGSDKKE